jgi:ATP phosphoribosyltransferase regulatory subunit HisZ
MKEITLTVDNHYVTTLLTFLKNLTYVQVQKVAESEPKSLTDAEKLALLFQISGAWKDERSTESILQDLQQTRLFNRNIESL